ncbi:MAG: MBOAT family protein, partial [Oscillospiraceae bacterium]|nr:MBOAT family protein [Oscillospiraceae bacterium]
MNFNSVNYIIFLPVVSALYFMIPQKLRNVYLLAVSYYFYFCNEARFFLLLPVLTVLTWALAQSVDRAEGKKRSGLFLRSLFANLGTLVFFKYNRFFLGHISSLTGAEFDLTKWMLPMGISFYIFMAASYLIDVYLKKYPAEKSLVKFAVYITFFPHILMGPIDRANKFLPQLDKEHKFEYERVRKALQLMALGFFKKIAVADIMAMFINRVHSDLYSYTGLILVFVAVLYSFQLYADFSGYCDIARGSAMIMGFDIAENFNVPYLSTSFSQFWSRWHISLSSWFQDYIFTPFVWTNPMKKLPVVGRFFENPPVIIAVILVFVTSGIWHGNTWNFVIWG